MSLEDKSLIIALSKNINVQKVEEKAITWNSVVQPLIVNNEIEHKKDEDFDFSIGGESLNGDQGIFSLISCSKFLGIPDQYEVSSEKSENNPIINQ